MNEIISKTLKKNMNAIDSFILDLIRKKESPTEQHYNDNKKFSFEQYNSRRVQILDYLERLNTLKKKKTIKQRTEEWYEIRNNMLTASDTLAGVKRYKSLVKKKALKINEKITNDAMTWGIMLEPVASAVYSFLNNRINVYEFGLVVDDEISYYGASPDGVTELGIMLEIKCPYSRKLKKDDIPDKYYAQMQGQMAVCHLKECDYSEFIFVPISQDEYLNHDDNNRLVGMVCQDDNDEYHYSNIREDPKTAFKRMYKDDWKKIVYWRLNDYQIQRVMFDDVKWNEYYLPNIKAFWDDVLSYSEVDFLD